MHQLNSLVVGAIKDESLERLVQLLANAINVVELNSAVGSNLAKARRVKDLLVGLPELAAIGWVRVALLEPQLGGGGVLVVEGQAVAGLGVDDGDVVGVSDVAAAVGAGGLRGG